MKKKLLFILLLLIPFMVKAINVNNYHLEWTYENDEKIRYVFTTEHNYIFVTENSIISVDKLTGEKKIKASAEHDPKAMFNEKLIVFKKLANGQTKITLYDEKFNQIKSNEYDFQNYEVTRYGSDELIVIEKRQIDGEYYLKVNFLNSEGELVKEDSFKTVTYFTSHRDYNVENNMKFVDFNNNIYDIINHKIVLENKNSDGSYMHLTNDHLYKYSSTGELIDSLEIPNGKGTRMVKKGDKYYIATGEYTETEPNKYNIKLNFYLVDENLNVLKTGSIDNYRASGNPGTDGYRSSVHSIFLDDNKVIAFVCYSEQDCISDELSEELTSTKRGTRSSYYRFNGIGEQVINKNNNFFENVNSSEEVYNEEFAIIRNKYIQDENYKNVSIRKGKKGYIVIEEFETCEGCNNGTGTQTKQEKIDIILLDSNLNEVFRKNIIDWSISEKSINYEIEYYNVYTGVYEYNDNYYVIANDGSHNKLLIYDQEGNLKIDLSNTLENYNNLFIKDIYVNEIGLYVHLSTMLHAIAGAYEMYTPNGVISVDAAPRLFNYEEKDGSIVLYYAADYGITKNITGKGTITETPERAEEGTRIRFTITPDPGYVLSVVKVTDANGNVLTFTDNTFVMPASNVTIEAVFVPANPKTSDIAILVICLIALSSLVIFALEKRRLNTLK